MRGRSRGKDDFDFENNSTKSGSSDPYLCFIPDKVAMRNDRRSKMVNSAAVLCPIVLKVTVHEVQVSPFSGVNCSAATGLFRIAEEVDGSVSA